MMQNQHGDLPVVGWREWVALPEFPVPAIKAKIDTGARTSSLHVIELERFKVGGRDWVRFGIHPQQRKATETVYASAEVVEYRRVRSSSGQASLRPVIITEVALLDRRWQIEVTLANRDAMGFRMLLGREAVRGRFHIDPGRSFYGKRPLRKKKNKSAAESAAKKTRKKAGMKRPGGRSTGRT